MKRLLLLAGCLVLVGSSAALAHAVTRDSMVVVRIAYLAGGRRIFFYRTTSTSRSRKPTAAQELVGSEAEQNEALKHLQVLLLQQGYTLESSVLPDLVPTGFEIYTKPKR